MSITWMIHKTGGLGHEVIRFFLSWAPLRELCPELPCNQAKTRSLCDTGSYPAVRQNHQAGLVRLSKGRLCLQERHRRRDQVPAGIRLYFLSLFISSNDLVWVQCTWNILTYHLSIEQCIESSLHSVNRWVVPGWNPVCIFVPCLWILFLLKVCCPLTPCIWIHYRTVLSIASLEWLFSPSSPMRLTR